MSDVIEKVYCTERPSGSNDTLLASILANQNKSGDMNPLMTAMAGNGGMGGFNNPWAYIMFMMMIWRMWGNNGLGENGAGAQGIETQNQLAAIRSQLDSNQNANLLRDAIAGSTAATHELASNLNCDFNSLKDSCCAINASIQNVAGQVGFSAERVINAANMGDLNIITQLKDCCCNTQRTILETAAENRLSICQQTNAIQNSITGGNYALTNALNSGFNSVSTGLNNLSFQNQQQTCAIQQSITSATQAVKDMLGNHWAQDLRDKNFQYSQDAQTNYIISQLKTA